MKKIINKLSLKLGFSLLLLVIFVQELTAQSLPSHQSLEILIVSDEVNPHGLSNEELTQPGDLSLALQSSSDLNTSLVTEIATNNIENATSQLLLKPRTLDVLIYFAHRIPNNDNQAQNRQEAFVTAVESFLQDGGAVISFHHGIYQTNGKQSMQALLGAQAVGSVPWDTVNGQDIIFVGEEHFIGTNNINYTEQVAYENVAHGIMADTYPAFTNTPDERYPQMDFNSGNSLCEIDILYESDYLDNGSQHLLSYLKYCPDWRSQIFVYQPGEYQPNALVGNNFQILLNALYFLSEYRWDIVYKSGFD